MYIDTAGPEVTEIYNWIVNELEIHSRDPDVSWIAVTTHFPPFVEEPLKEYFLPILKKYKIDIVFTAHDHWMEYSSMEYNYTLRYPDSRRGPITEHCEGTSKRELIRTPRSIKYKKGERIHQFMSGGGGAYMDKLCPIRDQDGDVLYRLTEPGFVGVEVTETEFNAIYYTEGATEVYRITIQQ